MKRNTKQKQVLPQTVFALFKGSMMQLAEPLCSPDKANFVIVCDYGDWSGFRTLPECKAQFAELEAKAKANNRGNFYYRVEER